MLYGFKYDSPVGQLSLIKENEKLISISFLDNSLPGPQSAKGKNFKEIIRQLNEYFFEGRRKFEIEYDLCSSVFGSMVYAEMLNIPYGESITYSDLASKVNKPKAYRAVGSACGRNPLPIIIPCHRVKSKSGLGGFTGGLHIKRFLLQLESN